MATEGLSSVCAGLGRNDDDSGKQVEYIKGEYCLDNLKDLVRFLRRDDPETRDVFKQLCKWNIVANDLIPIIEKYQDDRDLVLNSVKVLVFLTMPINTSSTDINDQLEYLWKLKTAITHSDAVAVILSLLETPLENLERDALTEEDRKLVQLVMTLFRNILAVQEISIHQKVDGSANLLLSLRDSFLALLFRDNVMDLFIVLAQHIGGYRCHLRQDNLLFLDIFHNIFKGHDSEYIAKVSQESKVDGDAKSCIESLGSIMKEEEEKKKIKRLNALRRHSQFSGTFARFTMDGSKTLYKGTPASCNALAKSKVHRGASKRVVWDQKRPPVINSDLLVSLHNFLNQFLSGAYNVLMQSIREDIEKEYHGIQQSDVLVFFELAQFVTSFQYYKSIRNKQHSEADMTEKTNGLDDGNPSLKDNICAPIAETMNQSMFELIISKWRYAFECLKETNDYKFLSTAGSLMKVMIRVLDLVLKREPVDSKEHQTACILLYKLFYDQTDQGLTQYLFNLMKSFDAHKQPKSDLANLVEMIHIILRLMESLETFGKLRVARKARRHRRKNDKDSAKNVDETQANQTIVHNNESSENPPACEQENPAIIHNESSENPSAVAQENEDVCNLQMEKGKSGHDSDLAHTTEASECEKQDGAENMTHVHRGDSDAVADQLMDGASNDPSSGDEKIVETNEVDFKLTTLLTSLVGNTTIKNICWLLKFYKSNSASTNHYIICMLRRICDDLDLSSMIYELSYLCTFSEILDEQKLCPHKDYKNIVDFLTTFVRRLLRKMKSQPLLFVEILFSKTRRDCHLINAQSMKLELGDMKNELKKWNHATDEGEASVLPGMKNTARNMADALGDDEFDVTMPCEPDNDGDDNSDTDPKVVHGTGKQYVRESEERSSPSQNGCTNRHVEEDIVEPSKKGNFNKGDKLRRKRMVFSDEMVEELRGLHDKYKNQKKCAYMIANALSPDGAITAAQVSRKLKQLSLRTGKQVVEGSIPITDEDPDNQTLASLKKRRNTQVNATSTTKKDSAAVSSDDEMLSSIIKRDTQVNATSTAEKDSAVVSSDDEMLSSIIKKFKTSLKRKEKLTAVTQQLFAGSESDSESPRVSSERNIRIQEPVAINMHVDTESDNNPNGSSGHEANDINNAKEEGIQPKNDLFDYEHSDDELADSGDQTTHIALPSSSVKRRKMVIDFEDDEE